MSGIYSKKFEKLFNVTRRVSKTCGVDFINPGYKYTWRTGILFFVINFGLGFTLYTVYLDVIVAGAYLNLLISITMMGTIIQGYTKFIIKVSKRDIVRLLYEEINSIYTEYEKKELVYRNELERSISRVEKIVSILFTLVLGTLSLILGLPVVLLIFYSKRTYIINLYLPFIDVETNFGYYTTFGIHIICLLFAGFGNFISDIWCFIYVAHVPLISDIFKCKLRDLDSILQAHPNDISKSKPVLLDVLKWHQKYNDYNNTIKDMYFWIFFAEITTKYVAITCTIVTAFLEIWPTAYPFLIFSFVFLYFFCAIGNIVEVANSDVIFNIYDSNWYLLSAPEQKMVLYMLRNAQEATGITIGGVTPLSLSTALQMTKSFYTLSMVLREFLN